MKVPRLPFTRRLRYVRNDVVGRAIEDHHLTQKDVAGLLGVSRVYWSDLFNRRRPVGPGMRTAMLNCPVFEGLAESDLWEIFEVPPTESP